MEIIVPKRYSCLFTGEEENDEHEQINSEQKKTDIIRFILPKLA